jgi:hypothetical protein
MPNGNTEMPDFRYVRELHEFKVSREEKIFDFESYEYYHVKPEDAFTEKPF